ncbi:hypothetical protein JCM24511_07531 [Saitozyma sp. JCM 24511]|nr:hypothetical protein JCM24511_07531 [Saitozyma sp. JCM 24511]
MPSSLVTAYEDLLVHNLSAVRSVESALRNVTWLLPGRFEDAELASEGLYALLSLVSSHHDTLISRRLSQTLSLPPHPFVPPPSAGTDAPTQPPLSRTSPLLPPPSEHARYTRYWTERSGVYRKASRTLATLGYVELLVEMLARRRGDRVRWRLVLLIESVKTFLRLVLLRPTRRPVLHPPTPQREVDITLLPTSVLDRPHTQGPPTTSVAEPGHAIPAPTGPNGSTFSVKPVLLDLPAHAPLTSHLYPMSGALPEALLPHPLTLLPPLETTSAYVSEIINSSATLIQLILLLRASRPPKGSPYRRLSLPTLSRSLPPFLIPLLLRLLARRIRPPPKDSLLLAQHYAQQDRRLVSSLFLTGPMWVGWTRPKVLGWVKTLERIPLVGLVGELVEGYLPLVDDYFYYTAS